MLIIFCSLFIVSLYLIQRLKSIGLDDPVHIPPRALDGLVGGVVGVEVLHELGEAPLIPRRHTPRGFISVPVAERLDGELAGVVLALRGDADAAEEEVDVGGVGHVISLVHSHFISYGAYNVNLTKSMG